MPPESTGVQPGGVRDWIERITEGEDRFYPKEYPMDLFRFGLLGSLVIGLAASHPVAAGKVAAAPAPKAKANKEKIIGSWQLTRLPNGDPPAGYTAEFTKDGKMKTTGDGEATYEVDGDRLTIRFTSPDGRPRQKTGTIVKLTDKELQIKDESGVMEFTKKK
jgi:uncharacterized protein (TIGR03066 family)